MGIPDEELAPVVEVFAPFFSEVGTNLRIAGILTEEPDLSLPDVASRLAGLKIKDIDHNVGVIRHLLKRDGLSESHHPLFFLDRVKTEGLHGEGEAARVITT